MGALCLEEAEETQVNVKRVIAWLLLAFIVFFIVSQPETSADMVRSAFRGLSNAASALANFLTSLF
jgi:thiosulfate reductase cytochrome b subunit